MIDDKNNNVGIVETSEALKMAREKGLDLIEVSPNANPPVCRIMDHGRYQYEKSRKEREQKTKQKKIGVKGIRISPRIGQHDLEFKVKQAEKFLEKGYKVKIETILKGREKWLIEAAQEKINKFIELISLEIVFDQEIKKEPRGLIAVISKTK